MSTTLAKRLLVGVGAFIALIIAVASCDPTPPPPSRSAVSTSSTTSSAAPTAAPTTGAAPTTTAPAPDMVGQTAPDLAPQTAPKPVPDVVPGATAVCNDGTVTHPLHHRGACSHHHGVAHWL